MTLEAFKKSKKLGVYDIVRNRPLEDGEYIGFDEADSVVTLKVQSGPVEECGENGCTPDVLVELASWLLAEANRKDPKRERRHRRTCAETRLAEAVQWLRAKKRF